MSELPKRRLVTFPVSGPLDDVVQDLRDELGQADIRVQEIGRSVISFDVPGPDGEASYGFIIGALVRFGVSILDRPKDRPMPAE
jgi:hypothetical protein